MVLWTALCCVLDAEQALTLGFYCCLHTVAGHAMLTCRSLQQLVSACHEPPWGGSSSVVAPSCPRLQNVRERTLESLPLIRHRWLC